MSISKYRPISLLTSFSEIFEKVISNRLFQHINNNQILTRANLTVSTTISYYQKWNSMV